MPVLHSWFCSYYLIQVKKEVGDVSILINNAGIVTGRKFLDCPDELIEKSFDVNFKAHLWVTIFPSRHKYKVTLMLKAPSSCSLVIVLASKQSPDFSVSDLS